MKPRTKTVLLGLAGLTLALSSCKREERDFRPDAPFARTVRFTEEYQNNAYALAEGKRLFRAFNCNGCHANGGGGIGPPLMDDTWIYGSSPDDIFTTLSAGRPNGMPAFGEKLPAYQIWQLVAYVRSMSGLAGSSAAPGRDDHLNAGPPENSRPQETPRKDPDPGFWEGP